MNDGPSSVRVPRLNLIRALNLPGREHDGIPVQIPMRVTEIGRPCRWRQRGYEGETWGRESVKARMEARCVRAYTLREGKAFCFENDGGVDPSRWWRRSTIRVEPIVMQITERSGPLLTRDHRPRRSLPEKGGWSFPRRSEGEAEGKTVVAFLPAQASNARVPVNYTGLS